MRRIRLAVPALLTALAIAPVAACGGGSSPTSSATTGPERPTDVVATTPASGTPTPGPSPATPKGGTLKPHKIPWTSAEPSADGRTIRVVWSSGVEPCYTLDRVEVSERAKSVTITLYEGPLRASPDVACIEIAIEKVTEVRLSKPLGDRKIIDGAR
ncbi:hypothetical protein AB0K60_26865 [Thermopolyspora sp. NPDC052614]|uniref:hypothetical protein n=1 Tax=Thermopolyspora sp. NPDC052614 TaxID=3155682 RepID=UPI00343983A6